MVDNLISHAQRAHLDHLSLAIWSGRVNETVWQANLQPLCTNEDQDSSSFYQRDTIHKGIHLGDLLPANLNKWCTNTFTGYMRDIRE